MHAAQSHLLCLEYVKNEKNMSTEVQALTPWLSPEADIVMAYIVSHGLHSYGLHSYGLYSDGLQR